MVVLLYIKAFDHIDSIAAWIWKF